MGGVSSCLLLDDFLILDKYFSLFNNNDNKNIIIAAGINEALYEKRIAST